MVRLKLGIWPKGTRFVSFWSCRVVQICWRRASLPGFRPIQVDSSVVPITLEMKFLQAFINGRNG